MSQAKRGESTAAYRPLTQEIMSAGGLTTLQEDSGEKFCRCFGIAENGILGALTLKSSLTLISVLDIILGVFYLMYLVQEVFWEWEYFNANGPHYILVAFYYLRVSSLPVGLVGFIAVSKQNALLARGYYTLTMIELAVFPLLGFLSSYDMCQSWLYRETCEQIYVQNAVFNFFRAGYLVYSAFIARSYQRRVERGEFILVQHGKAVVELINAVQNKQGKTDIELGAM